MQYQILGVDLISGKERAILVQADTEFDAASTAKTQGVLPTNVKAILGSSTADAQSVDSKARDPHSATLMWTIGRSFRHHFHKANAASNGLAVQWLSIVGIALCSAGVMILTKMNPLPPSRSAGEERASQVFQDSGVSKRDADKAAQLLNQMLERDRQRGR